MVLFFIGFIIGCTTMMTLIDILLELNILPFKNGFKRKVRSPLEKVLQISRGKN